ncbi:MAG: hypothetical protein LBE24_01585 [Methylobacillus sp.]|jgi:hypothetical protein|nr:hypothetical protein [Methylobacillus sp.]
MGAKLKSLVGLLAALLLSGCAGGMVAKQLAQSLATHAADAVIEQAIENSEPKLPEGTSLVNSLIVPEGVAASTQTTPSTQYVPFLQEAGNSPLGNTSQNSAPEASKPMTLADMDPDLVAFLTTPLITSVPSEPQEVMTANPDQDTGEVAPRNPAPNAEARISKLVTMEIWGLILGDEKHSTFETIRQLNIMPLPPEQQWDQWQLAEGGMSGTERPMLILIPPAIGKVRSGDLTVVEVGSVNGIYVATAWLERESKQATKTGKSSSKR